MHYVVHSIILLVHPSFHHFNSEYLYCHFVKFYTTIVLHNICVLNANLKRNLCGSVFTVFRLLTDFVCLYNYEFGLSLCKIVRSSVILLLPLFVIFYFLFCATCSVKILKRIN